MARQVLQQRLPVGSTVRLDEKTTDRYCRLVAKMFKWITFKLAMVEDGQALAYCQYLGDCNAREYLGAIPGQPAPLRVLAGGRRHYPPLGLPQGPPRCGDPRWDHSGCSPLQL
jgi:hypothetical protein